MTTDTQTRQTRYPGSRPFTQDDEALFFGRDEDIAKLTTFITVENITVLYGRSGLGKTSLLNAGVLPKLENEHQYCIIPVRFGSWVQDNRKHPLDIVEEKFEEMTRQENFLNNIESEDISLWQHIKNLELTLPNQTTLLLVFDQFEELFTYPEGVPDFAKALADLLYCRMPKEFQRALRLATRSNANLLTLERSEFLERPVKLKVLMSIRSDRMSLLNSLSSQIPSVLLNCYELKPLSREQAEKAVISPAQKVGEFQSPPFTYHPEALKKILDYLTQNGAKSIESFQLQILCQFIEENIVIGRNDTHVEEHDLGELETIYTNYYDNNLKKLGTEDEQRKARIFIEEGLIFAEEERRTTLFEGQIYSKFAISPELLSSLVDTHLIRSEPHSSGGYVYELSHDTLVAPILKAKSLRFENEQLQRAQQQLLEIKAKRKTKIKRALFIFLTPVIIFILFLVLVYFADIFRGNDFVKTLLLIIGIPVLVFYAIYAIFLILLFLAGPLAFVYEFISGESVLSKLRNRAIDPARQKGILTKIGRWLS